MVSQKCQYALRAVFELAKRHGQGPVSIAEVAESQSIPPRFLESILGEIRRAGFVESRRGAEGGYFLAVRPRSLSVGKIVRLIEGDPGPITCADDASRPSGCAIHDHCVFAPMWQQVHDAVSEIYDTTTFQDLVDREDQMRTDYVPDYVI